MGGDFLRRFAVNLGRRLVPLVAALIFLVAVVLLACAAIVVGLAHVLPLWAALSVTAAILLLLAVLALCLAARRSDEGIISGAARAPESEALRLGTMAGEAMRHRPKTTLAIALVLGIVLGADPKLRRDLLDLLKPSRR